jgi:hypothetical protein
MNSLSLTQRPQSTSPPILSNLDTASDPSAAQSEQTPHTEQDSAASQPGPIDSPITTIDLPAFWSPGLARALKQSVPLLALEAHPDNSFRFTLSEAGAEPQDFLALGALNDAVTLLQFLGLEERHFLQLVQGRQWGALVARGNAPLHVTIDHARQAGFIDQAQPALLLMWLQALQDMGAGEAIERLLGLCPGPLKDDLLRSAIALGQPETAATLLACCDSGSVNALALARLERSLLDTHSLPFGKVVELSSGPLRVEVMLAGLQWARGHLGGMNEHIAAALAQGLACTLEALAERDVIPMAELHELHVHALALQTAFTTDPLHAQAWLGSAIADQFRQFFDQTVDLPNHDQAKKEWMNRCGIAHEPVSALTVQRIEAALEAGSLQEALKLLQDLGHHDARVEQLRGQLLSIANKQLAAFRLATRFGMSLPAGASSLKPAEVQEVLACLAICVACAHDASQDDQIAALLKNLLKLPIDTGNSQDATRNGDGPSIALLPHPTVGDLLKYLLEGYLHHPGNWGTPEVADFAWLCQASPQLPIFIAQAFPEPPIPKIGFLLIAHGVMALERMIQDPNDETDRIVRQVRKLIQIELDVDAQPEGMQQDFLAAPLLALTHGTNALERCVALLQSVPSLVAMEGGKMGLLFGMFIKQLAIAYPESALPVLAGFLQAIEHDQRTKALPNAPQTRKWRANFLKSLTHGAYNSDLLTLKLIATYFRTLGGVNGLRYEDYDGIELPKFLLELMQRILRQSIKVSVDDFEVLGQLIMLTGLLAAETPNVLKTSTAAAADALLMADMRLSVDRLKFILADFGQSAATAAMAEWAAQHSIGGLNVLLYCLTCSPLLTQFDRLWNQYGPIGVASPLRRLLPGIDPEQALSHQYPKQIGLQYILWKMTTGGDAVARELFASERIREIVVDWLQTVCLFHMNSHSFPSNLTTLEFPLYLLSLNLDRLHLIPFIPRNRSRWLSMTPIETIAMFWNNTRDQPPPGLQRLCAIAQFSTALDATDLEDEDRHIAFHFAVGCLYGAIALKNGIRFTNLMEHLQLLQASIKASPEESFFWHRNALSQVIASVAQAQASSKAQTQTSKDLILFLQEALDCPEDWIREAVLPAFDDVIAQAAQGRHEWQKATEAMRAEVVSQVQRLFGHLRRNLL